MTMMVSKRKRETEAPIASVSLDFILKRQARGMRLAIARENRGFSRSELAAKLDVAAAAIIQWELGKNDPLLKHTIELCAILGVSADWIMTGADDTERFVTQTKQEEVILLGFRNMDETSQRAFVQLVREYRDNIQSKRVRRKVVSNSSAPTVRPAPHKQPVMEPEVLGAE